MTDQKFPMAVALSATPTKIEGLEDGGAYLVTAKVSASVIIHVGGAVPERSALPVSTYTAGLMDMWQEEGGEYRYFLHARGFSRCIVWFEKGAGHAAYAWSPSGDLSLAQAARGLEVLPHTPPLNFRSEVEILNRMLRLEAIAAKQNVPWTR